MSISYLSGIANYLIFCYNKQIVNLKGDLVSTTPVLAAVGFNSQDNGESHSITIFPITAGCEVEICWRADDGSQLRSRLEAEVNSRFEVSATEGYYEIKFSSDKSIADAIALLNKVMDGFDEDDYKLDDPVYWYPVPEGNQPDLAISVTEWQDNTNLLTITDGIPTNDPQAWRQLGEELTDANHERGAELVKAGLKIWSTGDTEVCATLPADADLLPAMYTIAMCYAKPA